MRLSSYLIDINLKNRPGKTLLMHGYTGAMDIVDNSLLESLKQADATGDFSNIDNSIIELLVKRNYLTEKTKEEEIEYVCRVAKILAKRNKLLNPAMFTIIVTYDCNFSCPYCFERKIIKKNMPLRSWTMDQETVDKVFTAILAIAPNEKQRNKTILLFGGEPLLKNNYDIVKYIILKGREGGYGFDAITNGFDLDCYSEFLGNDIKSVQVTIDGTRDTHDIRRPFGKNGKSFDKIISNIKIGLDKGVYVSARINVDADNIEEVGKLDAFFEHEKLYEYNNFSPYAYFISGDVNSCPDTYILHNKSSNSRKNFLELLEQPSGRIKYETELFPKLKNAVKKKLPFTLKPYFCSSHEGVYCFDPFGNIYPCIEAIGHNEQIIGNYNNGISWIEEVKSKWLNRNICHLTECRRCKYALLCGGGCFQRAIIANKENVCNDFPMRLESTINKIII